MSTDAKPPGELSGPGGAGRKRPGGEDGSPAADEWEDILSLRVDSDAAEEAPRRPVRLSSLRPPAKGPPPPDGTRGGASSLAAAVGLSNGPPQERIPTAPLPLRPGDRWEAGGGIPSAGAFTEKRLQKENKELQRREKGALQRIKESEEARQAAQARVAELQRELADLRARMAYEREAARRTVTNGTDDRELERLRAELAEAREIIRAMEEAYLAGEGFARGGPPK